VPEFFYKPLYHNGHRFKCISSDPEKKERKEQIGFREQLLCWECEQMLSKHERYVREFLFGKSEYYLQQNGNRLWVSGLNYDHVRLCFLSILWRMGVSSLGMFSEVDLGVHEERLRQMIRSGSSGKPHEYGFICVIPRHEGEAFFDDLMLPPDRIRTCGHNAYRVTRSGLFFIFVVSSHKQNAEVESHFIQSDGSWVFVNESIEKIPFMHNWLRSVGQAAVQRDKMQFD
jgi:hypothetical protein